MEDLQQGDSVEVRATCVVVANYKYSGVVVVRGLRSDEDSYVSPVFCTRLARQLQIGDFVECPEGLEWEIRCIDPEDGACLLRDITGSDHTIYNVSDLKRIEKA